MFAAKTIVIAAMAISALAGDATTSTVADQTVVLHSQKANPDLRNEVTGEQHEIDRSAMTGVTAGKPLPVRAAGDEKNHGHKCGNKFQVPVLPEGGSTVTPNADAIAKTSSNADATAKESKATSAKLQVEKTDVESRRGKTNGDNAVTTVENEVKTVESAVAAVCGQPAKAGDPTPPTTDLKQLVSNIFASRPTLQPGATWPTREHIERTGTRVTDRPRPESSPHGKRDGTDPATAPKDDVDETEQEEMEIEQARTQFSGGTFTREKVADLTTVCQRLRAEREGTSGSGSTGGSGSGSSGSGSGSGDTKTRKRDGTPATTAGAAAEPPSKAEDDENTSTVTGLVDRLKSHCGVDFKTSTNTDVASVGATLDQACKDAATRIAGALGDFQKSKDLGDRQKSVETKKDDVDETADAAEKLKADADKCKTFVAMNADLVKANADLKAARDDPVCAKANAVCDKKASGKKGTAKVDGDNTAEAPVPAADAGLTKSESSDVAACKAKLETARDAVKAAVQKTDGEWKSNCGLHLGWKKECNRRRAIKACFKVSNAISADAPITDEVEAVKAAWKAKHHELCDKPAAEDAAACAATKDAINNAQVEKSVSEAPEPAKDVDGMRLRDAKACVTTPEPVVPPTSTVNGAAKTRKRAGDMIDAVVTKMITNPASTTTTCTGLKFVAAPVPAGVPLTSDVTTVDNSLPVDRVIVDGSSASSATTVIISTTAALIGFVALFF